MLGVLVNTLGVILGSLLGLAFRRGIPERIAQAIMTAIGLSTVYIGLSGALQTRHPMALILAMVLGAGTGTALNLDGALMRLGERLQRRFQKEGDAHSFGEGFVTASLLFCVGSMAIMGSLNAGISGDHSTLYAKSVLDTVSSVMLAASLGLGVMLSAGPVLFYQGAIVLLAGLLQPLLTDAMIANMNGVGGLLILALGLNLLKLSHIKVADLLPAILLAPLASLLFA